MALRRQGARAKPTGQWTEVELRVRRDEAEPGNPHSTVELVTGNPNVDPSCMAKPIDELKG